MSYLKELALTPGQENGMLDIAEEALSYANRRGNTGIEIPRCAAAKGLFVVDPSGDIRACNHSPRIVGHIFKSPMITDVEYWNMFAYSDYKPEMCSGCKISHLCDCGCREVAKFLFSTEK